MTVPPFVPQPIEIPGNVTTKPYLVIVGFVRRVSLAHFASVLAVATFALYGRPVGSILALSGVTFCFLAGLNLLRTFAGGWRGEHLISLAAFPLFLACLGLTMRIFFDRGWPVWAPGLGLLMALAYTLSCGRDLSYVGMFAISGVVSTAAILVFAVLHRLPGQEIAAACLLNAGFLFYHVYDLASLLSRRRLGEELGAVIDLYRDVLNIFGYVPRVARHWREHRIWSK